MNKREYISAFMDGESGHEAEALLGHISADPALRKVWQRYHLIRDSLRGQLPAHLPRADVAARIAAAVAEEPSILTPNSHPVTPHRKTPAQRALKPVVGLAIAASVAIVAIIGVRGLDQATSTGATPAAMQTVAETESATASESLVQSLQPAPQAPLARTVSTESQQQPVQPNYQQSDGGYGFDSYLINHNEYRANAGARGITPYARIVAPNDAEQ